MKIWQQVVGGSAIAASLLGGAMLVTNPSPIDYERYATLRLSEYLKENMCNQLPAQFQQFASQCQFLGGVLVDIGRPQLQELIGEQTERENYLFFSVYRTNLAIHSDLPTYEFATIGVLQYFILYSAEQR
ncbi:DUF4359 domain-containing protein [Spirulina subsalsa]|uniref:DUF4359 domain-containing protein n=1 Tax=Spirulina subsalsa TaxID=54311 RepID=UPI00030B57D2|nr:DUF4359 domain-containing protein [Spirulina subsalsa]